MKIVFLNFNTLKVLCLFRHLTLILASIIYYICKFKRDKGVTKAGMGKLSPRRHMQLSEIFNAAS